MVDSALLAYLLSAAVQLSGYPTVTIDELPEIRMVSRTVLRAEICPAASDGCDDLAAIFDTNSYRILIRDDLDLERASDNSFLVHELVHVLQYKLYGESIFDGCARTMRTENEAYRAQNLYLKREGQFLRYGEMLAFMACGQEDGTTSGSAIRLQPVLVPR